MNFNYFVPTGHIIKEYLDELGISQKSLSDRINISEKHISNILNGKSRLTEEVALKLECIFKSIPASYWLNIETKYREFLARKAMEEKFVVEDLENISKRFHFKDVFKGTNWLIIDQAKEMLKLLKISDFNNFNDAYANIPVGFMEDGGQKEAIAVWLKLCEEEIEIQNHNIEDTKYDKLTLEDNLQNFKHIATNKNLDQSLESCRKLCNNLGIYLVIRETITNCKVRGAITTYNSHPAIFLSLRFKKHDHAWFAFIHEIGHLLLHYNNEDLIISFENDQDKNKKDKEANEFARDFFIDPNDYEEFIKMKDYSLSSINEFAAKQGVQYGIVIARLQHDGNINVSKYNYKR